jgi:hypothetical protein
MDPEWLFDIRQLFVLILLIERSQRLLEADVRRNSYPNTRPYNLRFSLQGCDLNLIFLEFSNEKISAYESEHFWPVKVRFELRTIDA